MWELEYKESWVLKKQCFWTVVLEKTLESPSDCKEIQPVYPEGDLSWVFTGWTDVEAETPILWPLDVKNWFTGKDPDAGKIEGKRRKWQRMRQIAASSHWTRIWENLEDSKGQRSLECCRPEGFKESDLKTRDWKTRKVGMDGSGGTTKWDPSLPGLQISSPSLWPVLLLPATTEDQVGFDEHLCPFVGWSMFMKLKYQGARQGHLLP